MVRIARYNVIVAALTCSLAGSALGHGLIQSPPSRNWFCGAVTKPDQVANGVAEFPVCGDAFAFDPIAGYSFMSVLTHTLGRSVVGPRPNVCGFNSESFNGGATVWDQPINWPTSNMSSGLQTFTWNISWGPHFSDTQEFRYWITKPSFQFQVGKALSFDDFEDQPFCVLAYDDTNPTGNPNIIPDKANALFQTRCNVPVRAGRQIIYAEWGRNQFTFERFHSCVDVVFQNGPVISARIALSPSATDVTGPSTITLDASSSVGAGLSYQWSVSGPNPSLYTLTNANQRIATLALANPAAAAKISVSLAVVSASGSDTATISLVHHPLGGSPWFDGGLLNTAPRILTVGNRISMRAVSSTGQDVFLPSSPLVITAANAAADAWPFELGQAVNALGGSIRIGVLNAQGQIAPVRDAIANRIFTVAAANVSGAFLQVAPPAASCRINYRIDTQWNTGFQSSISVVNTSSNIPVVGYTLTWSMGSGEAFSSGWNATFTPSGQGLAASNTAGAWNGVIAPNGGTASFGFLGSKTAASTAVPSDFRLNGEPCQVGATAQVSPARSIALALALTGHPEGLPPQHCEHAPLAAPPPARPVSTTLRRRLRAVPARRRGGRRRARP